MKYFKFYARVISLVMVLLIGIGLFIGSIYGGRVAVRHGEQRSRDYWGKPIVTTVTVGPLHAIDGSNYKDATLTYFKAGKPIPISTRLDWPLFNSKQLSVWIGKDGQTWIPSFDGDEPYNDSGAGLPAMILGVLVWIIAFVLVMFSVGFLWDTEYPKKSLLTPQPSQATA